MCATFVCDENSSVACLHDVKRKLSWEFEKTGIHYRKEREPFCDFLNDLHRSFRKKTQFLAIKNSLWIWCTL